MWTINSIVDSKMNKSIHSHDFNGLRLAITSETNDELPRST